MRIISDLFSKCKNILLKREKQYGDSKYSFAGIAAKWQLYTGATIDKKDVAIMMALLKINRIQNANIHNTDIKTLEDSYVDAINYLAFAYKFHIQEINEKKNFDELYKDIPFKD